MFLNKKSVKNAILIMSLIGIVFLASTTAMAQGEDTAPDLKAIGAALAVGIAGAAASIGMAMSGSAAIGAIVENPDLFGKTFLFIVLIEAVAIYGLLVAIMILLF